MDARAAQLISDGLTTNSRKVYSHAIVKFCNFCELYQFNPFHVDELLILRFITHLAGANYSPSTVRVYLSGIRAWLLNMGSQPPLLYTPRVKWAIRALERSTPPPIRVKPFTLSMFWAIAPFVSPTFDNIVLFSAMLMGYFGCMRSSEYTFAPGSGPPLMPTHLRFVDSVPPHVVVAVQSSKTAAHGFQAVIGCTGTKICAVCWLRVMLITRSLPPSLPLFSLENGTPVSRAMLAQFMQGAIRAAGLDPTGYSTHSLRAGAATDAAGLGFSEAQIQSLGRWRSQAYKLYIRPTQAQQAANSASLASACPRGHFR